MKLAYTIGLGRGDTDAILYDVARAVQASGLRLAGTVQINSEQPCDGPCDMDVLVLPEGPTIRISQSLGPGARGCRLNPDALEQAVAAAQTQLARGAEAVLINKFGKHEADGRGFRDVIAQALEHDVPVVVGLNRANQAAFDQFCGGEATELPPNRADILAWLNGHLDAART